MSIRLPPPSPDEPPGITEFRELLADPIWRGKGIRKGDGRLVFLIPGMFRQDLYMRPLKEWLARIGYEPTEGHLLMEGGCPERLSRLVSVALEYNRRGRRRRVAVIGHSQGGVLGRVMAARLGAQVSHLVMLGAPINVMVNAPARTPEEVRQKEAAQSIIEAGRKAIRERDPNCGFPTCLCPFPRDLRRELAPETRVLVMHSTTDPVITEWAARVQGARTVAVNGSHTGLTLNKQVFHEIAAWLATTE